MARITADQAVTWVLNQMETAIFPESGVSKRRFVNRPVPQRPRDDGIDNRVFYYYLDAQGRSDAIFGAQDIILRLVINYQGGLVLQDNDIVQEHFDSVILTNGIVSVTVGELYQEGEDDGSPVIETLLPVQITYLPPSLP